MVFKQVSNLKQDRFHLDVKQGTTNDEGKEISSKNKFTF